MNFEKISYYLTESLCEAGVHAVDAWEGKRSCDHGIVVVSLGECAVESSGMGDYLGQKEIDGVLEEVYGKRCCVTLGLCFYAPPQGGEKMIQEELNRVLGVLSEKERTFRMASFIAGVTGLDSVTGLLKREVSVKTHVYLSYLEGSEEMFMDFNIKGVLNNASK